MGFKTKNKTNVKGSLTPYSTKLELNIDAFTEIIRDEVKDFLDATDAVDRNDTVQVVRALVSYQGVVSHLITEYRRIAYRYRESFNDYEKIETSAFNFARAELSAKSTEKQIKQKAFEEHSDELYSHRNLMEDLEQKMKTLRDYIDHAKIGISALQTAANIMKIEWEAGKSV
jgi:chromosome segregation ATPase